MLRSVGTSVELAGACEVSKGVFRPLSQIEALRLEAECLDDGVQLAQAAVATLAEATLALQEQRFTWATVKLYYCCFYSLRALLFFESICVFYRDKSPYSITCRGGEVFVRRKGNSHLVVFSAFRHTFPNDILLSQPITGLDPLDWLEDLRNRANYTMAPIPDPDVPAHMLAPSRRLRQYFSTYIADDSYLYAFQPEHAALAFPIAAIKRLDAELKRRGRVVEVSAHFRNIFTRADCDVGSLRGLQSFHIQ